MRIGAPSLLVLAAASALAAAPEPEPLHATLEKALQAEQEKLEAAHATLLELGRQVDPQIEELPGPFGELFGLDKLRAPFRKIREAAARMTLTTYDLDGIQAYAAGDLKLAALQFRLAAAHSASPELPTYYIGAIAFDEGDWARARTHFAKVVAHNAACHNALLMRRLSELCAGEKGLSPLTLLLRFRQACRETMDRVGPKGDSLAAGLQRVLDTPLTHDPVLYKSLELRIAVLVEQNRAVLSETLEEKDPQRRLLLACLLRSQTLRRAAIQSVAADHPEHRGAQALAFYVRHYDQPHKNTRKGSKTFPTDLAAVQALDPDNGALLLRSIPERKAPTGPDGAPAEMPPLNAEQLALFHRAVHAPRFDSEGPTSDIGRRLATEGLRRYGGFWPADGGLGWCPYTHVHNVAEQAESAAAALLDRGETDAALAVVAHLKTLAKRVGEEGSGPLYGLRQRSILRSLYERLEPLAARRGLDDLAEECLRERYAADHWEGILRAAFDHTLALSRTPIRRLAGLFVRLDTDAAFAQRVGQAALRRETDRYYRKATARLKGDPEASVPSMLYGDIVLLALVTDRRTAPLLRPLVRHDDRYLAYAARRAPDAIEGRKPTP